MNKNKIKIIKFKMSKKAKYDLIKFLEIRFADPISSMKLVNNYFVYGTLMGRLNLYNIKELINDNKLILNGNYLFINPKYYYLSNEILINFI